MVFLGKATSKEFDITLMIALIRNFIKTIGHVIVIKPTNNNWDSLPDPKDIEKGDDLARIKSYRNFMAHSKDDTLDVTTFKSNWKNVKEVPVKDRII